MLRLNESNLIAGGSPMARSFARAILRWSFGSMPLFGVSSGDAFAQGTLGGNWTGGSFTFAEQKDRAA